MRRLLLPWLAALLGIALQAEAHEVNLVTARVALTPDRSVSVELGLKGSDVDRLIGTKAYDARRDAVDPAAVEAARNAFIRSCFSLIRARRSSRRARARMPARNSP